MFDREAHKERVKWFVHDRFGLFIHWGLYAIPAKGEWHRSAFHTTIEEYQQYFDEFDPTEFDAKKWAKLAKEAGMKYAVLTAKHHDGFCLFDSKLTDYKSTNTKFGRDIIAEYTEAFRNEGIKVGLYYSLIDWHHEDFPHFSDPLHPHTKDENHKDENRNFNRYLDYMHGQIREICTNYGKLDLLWFDFSYDDMRGEKWKATELVRMVRQLQPTAMMDNRLEADGIEFGSLITENPNEYCGDFVSPEQIIPPKGILDYEGERAVWEACMTMNGLWGYIQQDKNFKPASMCIKKLVECVSKGGNMLLNVGPNAKGSFPSESVAILEDIGAWMKANYKSIYGCGCADMEKPDYGRITRNGNKLYYHMYENTVGPVPLYGIKTEDIEKIRLLHDGSELKPCKEWPATAYPEVAFVDLGPNPILPDNTDTVIEVTLI